MKILLSAGCGRLISKNGWVIRMESNVVSAGKSAFLLCDAFLAGDMRCKQTLPERAERCPKGQANILLKSNAAGGVQVSRIDKGYKDGYPAFLDYCHHQ